MTQKQGRGWMLIWLWLGLLVAGCTDAGVASKPTVVIAAPLHGSVFRAGETVAVQSATADPNGIVRVELRVDQQLIKTDTPPVAQGQPQFSLIQTWMAQGVGEHIITVRAYNAAGASAESGIVIRVNEAEIASPTALRGAATPTSTDAIALRPNTPTPTGTIDLRPSAVVSPTPGEATPTRAPATTPAPPPCTLNAQFIADVTIPDGTTVAPGTAFVKTWRVRNNGTCAWDNTFQLVFAGGAQMTNVAQAPLPPTAPQATADLSLSLQAPTAPGVYRGIWRLRASNGIFFGTNLIVLINVPAPTTIPPTPVPAQPTATPPPTASVVDQPPFDGGVNLVQIGPGAADPLVTNALVFEVTAHAGGENGFGIRNVQLLILELNGQVVYEHTENNPPYCMFGDQNGQCNVYNFQNGRKWPNGRTIRNGTYFLRAFARAQDGRIRTAETAMDIRPPGTDQNRVRVEIKQTIEFDALREVQDALVFQVAARDERAGEQDGAWIDRVDLFILNRLGQVVHQRTERNVKYCAFSGGDGDNPCEIWRFAEHAFKWPSGAPIYESEYSLRAIAYAKDGAVGAAAMVIEIVK